MSVPAIIPRYEARSSAHNGGETTPGDERGKREREREIAASTSLAILLSNTARNSPAARILFRTTRVFYETRRVLINFSSAQLKCFTRLSPYSLSSTLPRYTQLIILVLNLRSYSVNELPINFSFCNTLKIYDQTHITKFSKILNERCLVKIV